MKCCLEDSSLPVHGSGQERGGGYMVSHSKTIMVPDRQDGNGRETVLAINLKLMSIDGTDILL